MTTEFQHQRIQVPTGIETNENGIVEAVWESRLVTSLEELKQANADIKAFQEKHGARKFKNATKILDKFGLSVKVANTDLPDVKEHKRNHPHTKPRAFMGPNYDPEDTHDNHLDKK